MPGVFAFGEYVRLVIGDCELWFATEGDGAGDRAGLRIDCSCVFAGTIESEDALRSGIINDRVGVLARRRGSQNLQCLGIEDRDIAIPPIAYETLVHIVGDGDAVYAVRVRNVTDDSSVVGIDHHYVSAARDVNASRFAVDS